MSTRDEFLEQVRDAMNHLYDYPYLAEHRLALRFWPQELEGANRAQRLHRLLLETIEELHPATGPAKDAAQARYYSFLVYRYVEGWSRAEIMQEFICSRRQFFREQQKALMMLAALLWEKLPQQAGASEPPDALAIEASLLAQREPVDLLQLLPGVFEAIKPLAEQHGVTLKQEVGAHLPPIHGNRTLLRQVLLRSLSELITRPGTERILLRMHHDEGRVLIELQAAPCPPGAHDEWDGSPLNAARRLIEMLGGEWLAAESTASGRGYRCAFSTGGDDKRLLLVVEDNEAVIRAFRRYLKGYAYRVIGATSGAEALRLARELRPAAITLDVMMPAQDGWEILQTLKNDPCVRHIPVIVCSALEDPELARSLDAVAYLHKPVTQAGLLSALAKLPSGENAKGAATASRAPRR